MGRKLATIQKIKELNPIPNADSLELATVLGWKVVVKKGEFQVDDYVIYCEVDSVLPDKPEFEFLRSKKFRVKTIRLRGQISQGIVFSIDQITNTYPDKFIHLKEGEDITELLDITLYAPEIPACLKGLVKGPFPSFIPKTDETRIQVLQEVLTRHKDTECYVTEKIDGTSVTYYLKDGVFGVCSRNMELLESEGNTYWEMAKKYDIENKLRTLKEGTSEPFSFDGYDYAFQGEIVGNGIQGNPLKLPDKRLYIFNVFNINEYMYENYREFDFICNKLKLDTVPVLYDNFSLVDDIDTLTELSKGYSQLNPKCLREGIVIRPIEEKIDLQMSNDFNNGRVSFKAINPEYLIEVEK
jgi:RNA ligase (TIGR02306 family)